MTTLVSFLKSYYLNVCLVIFAFILRVINIGDYRRFAMDEVYYVPDSISMMKNGYEVDWVEGSFNNDNSLALSKSVLSGNYDYFSSNFSASHPPLGKMLIGLGMMIFGFDNPVGWRFSAVIAGTLIVALVMILAYIVFKNKYISLASGILIALDPMAISMSRVSHLDIFLTLFVLVGVIFAALYIKSIVSQHVKSRYLYLMAVSFGLASSIKWSGLYYFIVFAVSLVVIDLIFNRQHLNVKNVFSILSRYVLVSVLYVSVYVSTWFSWIINVKIANGSNIFDSFKELYLLHIKLLGGHAGLDSLHNYNSNAFEWILAARPTLLNQVFYDDGNMQFISTMPNIIFWILSVISILIFIVLVALNLKSNILQSVLILAVVAGWVPWMLFYGRTIFQFYTVVFQPYLYIILAFMAYLAYKKIASNTNLSIFKLSFSVVALFSFMLSIALYYGSMVVMQKEDNFSYKIVNSWVELTKKSGLYDSSQAPSYNLESEKVE